MNRPQPIVGAALLGCAAVDAVVQWPAYFSWHGTKGLTTVLTTEVSA